MGMVKDWQAKAGQMDDVPDVRITEDQKERVRRLICANAQGDDLGELIADAEELMSALGVHPLQDCDEPQLAPPTPTHRLLV